jgi:hypothetical protein
MITVYSILISPRSDYSTATEEALSLEGGRKSELPWKYSLVAAVANLNPQPLLLGKERNIYKKRGFSPSKNTLSLRERETDKGLGVSN